MSEDTFEQEIARSRDYWFQQWQKADREISRLTAELENWKQESIARGIYLANAIAEAGVLRQQHKEMVSIINLDNWAEKRFTYYQTHPQRSGDEGPCYHMWQDLIILIEYMRKRVDRNNDNPT